MIITNAGIYAILNGNTFKEWRSLVAGTEYELGSVKVQTLGIKPNYNPKTQALQETITVRDNDVLLSYDAIAVSLEPREIDARRLRIALSRLGYLSNVKALVAQADEETKINWESAAFVREDFPLVQAVIVTLKLSQANVDEIFDLAFSLT